MFADVQNELYPLEKQPAMFEVWKVTGTPTTIIAIDSTSGVGRRRPMFRFNRVVKAGELKTAIDFAIKQVADGKIPSDGDLLRSLEPEAPAP